MIQDRLNEYRIMWIICCFDLPVTTKKEQKTANEFRKFLIKDGFAMIQFSIYGRHCPSKESAEMHTHRVQKNIHEKGAIFVFKITDKQFGNAIFYINHKKEPPPKTWQQLELF